jgi:hypothetical protein
MMLKNEKELNSIYSSLESLSEYFSSDSMSLSKSALAVFQNQLINLQETLKLISNGRTQTYRNNTKSTRRVIRTKKKSRTS